MNRLSHGKWQSAAALAAALVVCTAGALAQDVGRLLPEAERSTAEKLEFPGAADGGEIEGGGEVLIEALVGIELAGDIDPPAARELNALLVERVGSPLTLGGLVEIADAVVAHYQSHGVPAVEVLVPEQEVTDGRVTLMVVEGVIGDVALAGGEHFDTERLARGVRSRTGESLTTRVLYGDLDWLNRNRFHDARLTVAPGDEMAEADLLFTLSDTRPFRVFGGYENSGVDVVGEERWLAGFEWGDVFGLGHRMVYQATLGADIESFRAHALDYRVPLPWRHEIGFQAAIVQSEIELEDGTASGGTSWLLGAGYTVALPRALNGALQHELTAGFEWKSTDNNLEFGGAEVFASSAEIAQFTARYSGTLHREDSTTSFNSGLVYSPGDLTNANSDAAFAGIRGDARSEYVAVRGGARHVRRLRGGASVMLRAGGQWTDTPLLPSEQFALGGHDTVRGYSERDGLGDIGYFGSLEVRAPAFPGVPVLDDRWQLLGFVDYGRSWAKGGRGGETDREFAAAGPGLRYRVADRVSLRFDYGWRLDGGGSRSHIGVRVEF